MKRTRFEIPTPEELREERAIERHKAEKRAIAEQASQRSFQIIMEAIFWVAFACLVATFMKLCGV